MRRRRGDYAGALAFARQMLFSPIEGTDAYSHYVNIMQGVANYHRARAVDAWERHDWPVLADALEREMDNGPPDLDLLERVLPELQKADAVAGKKVLDRASDRVRTVAQDYPGIKAFQNQWARAQALANR